MAMLAEGRDIYYSGEFLPVLDGTEPKPARVFKCSAAKSCAKSLGVWAGCSHGSVEGIATVCLGNEAGEKG
jgi:hypothetical protein